MPPRHMAGLSNEENLDAMRFDANNPGDRKRLENDVFSGKKSPIEGIEQFVEAMKDKLKM